MANETRAAEETSAEEAGAEEPAAQDAAAEERDAANAGQEPAQDGGVDTPESLREALEAAEDRALRAAAEAENVRKRAERSIENAHKFALEKFVAALLPAVDSFERAADAAAHADGNANAEGIQLSLKLLAEAMERQGVAVVDPLGEPFDPNLHEAMSMIESDTAEPGSVLEVFQRGYALNGRLVRPARVIVAKARPAEPEEAPSPADDARPATEEDDA